ncbi:hypothetical protein M9H77_16545 [Catharanthus roseus]|uniref:Uncharacterized protein n=1 Tax=Catharanthus roseus TaxID=4058 RepID=A0ACC0B230_CATRO|nr:hypothetical protein M9H77_16545 [Catharanthus roseus]
MSDSRSFNHSNKAMSESSQSRQPEPIRENTPHPEQATHMIIENFMIKMTELLETLTATRRNDRDILKYEDALKNNFQEELKKEYILRWLCEQSNLTVAQYTTKFNRHWLPYHQWDSRQQLKRPQGRRWQIEQLFRGRQLLAQLQPPINVLDKDHGSLEIPRDLKLRSCFQCGKPGRTKDQCPETQQVPLETSRRAG